MIVLKIIGWVLLGILALIILALCLKVHVDVEYSSENTSAFLRYLFLRIPLYPKQPGSKKKKKEDTSEKEEEKKEEEEKDKDKKSGSSGLLQTLYEAEGIDGLILITKRTFRYLGTFLGSLIRWIVVEEFYLDVRCHRDDAAATAIYYGEVCSTVFPMLGSLVSKCKVKKYDINIYPDYIARFSSASFIVHLRFIPIVLIGHLLALVLKLVFKVVLQIIVKIFLSSKDKTKTENENTKLKEKSEVTNE